MEEIRDLRWEYESDVLRKKDIAESPIEQFSTWLKDAIASEIQDPNAMVLSTVDNLGQPSSRVVLLRRFDEFGFLFFSNYTSRKAIELSSNAQGALLFYWAPLHRQVRIEGTVTQADVEESDAYFATRPVDSQIGAWASPQSATIPDRKSLDENFERYRARFKDGKVPRPSYWGGFVLSPQRMEFWQGRPSRLHDRLRYTRTETDWKIERLAP